MAFPKPARTWLTRDEAPEAGYNVYFEKPSPEQCVWGIWEGEALDLCPDMFHAAFPDVELKPGEGPVEVRFQVHEVRRGKLVK